MIRVQTDPRSLFTRILSRNDIYLANHSLGRPPDRTADDVARAVEIWYSDMDAAWDNWMAEMNLWRANIAKLAGLPRHDCVVPKTSAGQGLRAVLNSFPQDKPVRVVSTRGEFDSVDFILKTYEALGRARVSWVEPSGSESGVPIFSSEMLLDEVRKGCDLLVVSLVFFGTAQILQNARELINGAHEQGALVMLDVYHAAGVLPLSLGADDADFAIGGSYKYLRGGPGTCYLAINPRIFDSGRRTLDTGWFAKEDTFSYSRSDTPEFSAGGDGWLESTPPVLQPYQAKAGLEFVLEYGVDNLRAASLRQQSEMREEFRKHGIEMFEPKNPEQFGAFSLLKTANAREFSSRLQREGVTTDARGDFVRFGPDVLTTKKEFERAAEITARLLRD